MNHGSNPPGGAGDGDHPILPPGMALRAFCLSLWLALNTFALVRPSLPLLQDVKLAGEGPLALFGKKFLALAGLRPDYSGIWSATLS
jgi:hypothetical protein